MSDREKLLRVLAQALRTSGNGHLSNAAQEGADRAYWALVGYLSRPEIREQAFSFNRWYDTQEDGDWYSLFFANLGFDGVDIKK